MTESREQYEFFQQLAQSARDAQNARAELAWQIEPRPVDPDIEAAANREIPSGHVAFLGTTALPPYRPE